MKIGILAMTSPSSGGIYQYTQVLLESLTRYSTNYDYLIIKNRELRTSELDINSGCESTEIKAKPSNILLKLKRIIYVSFPIVRNHLDTSSNYELIKKYKVDLIISPIISLTPLYISKPYIMTIHDLQHKYYPRFFTLRERLMRNYIYKNAAKNALSIVCESRFVKRDIAKFWGISVDKIRVIPSPPLFCLLKLEATDDFLEKVKIRYDLPERFLFYPAHFWHHKNHINLVGAAKMLKDAYGKEINLVFVGLKKKNFYRAMKEIRKLGLGERVKYLGYVPHQDMPYLYKLATALIMPTFFESISMPIWEAFYLGCPVVSSNVCALPEQVGDAGLLFDPNNVEDMAEKIHRIWTDENLRQELIKKGYERVKDMTIENYARQWENVIEEAKRKDR